MTRFVSALRRAPYLRITGERQRLLASFAAVFLFGLLAHGYAFTNFTVSHDSLNEMFLSGDIRYAAGSVADWKISLGRFLYPAYRAVFSGGAGTPWLSGVLSLVWVSLAVYLVSRLFSVDNALLLAVIGALFVTNVSYSALAATYIYDLDGDMLAMLLAVCAAYLLLRGTLRRRALAVIPIVCSLALYQAMISVTVSLVMIACILRLLESESAKAVFFDGLKAVGILFIGGAAYYILVRAVCSTSDVALGSVSQITGAWVKSTVGGGYYAAYFSYILQTPIRIGSESELPEGAQPDAMPPFPAEGSICRAGDMLIVRMG